MLDRGNLLQLTNLRRRDTRDPTVGADGQRVFFIASANPFATNPTENCQLFSVDTLGTNLRQLTDFSHGGHSALGCANAQGLIVGGPPPGCMISNPRPEPMSGVLAFQSSCDPVGTNPFGEQIFAMYPDGTGLQQLSDTRGASFEADGTVDVEIPGPWASTAARR